MIDDETRGRTKGICLHFDGINQRLPFRLADYGDDGALTEDQICAVAESSGLDLDLARNLSVLLGYALDLDSQVNLVRVKPVKPGKHTRADDRNFKVSLVDAVRNELFANIAKRTPSLRMRINSQWPIPSAMWGGDTAYYSSFDKPRCHCAL